MANDFAPGLSGICTVNYNGVDLSGADLSMSLNMQVIYDEAERTQDSVLLHFRFATVLMTADIQGAINALTVPGGRLRVYDGGFVDYDINASGGGGVRDINWGPKPRVLNWTPHVGKLGYLLEYEIETRLPYCPDAGVVYQRALKSLTYSVSHSFDRFGLTTRTIAGLLTIPLTRVSQTSRSTPDSADNYYNLIKAEPPLGFIRVDNSRSLSEDRSTLTWSITDVQSESDISLPGNVIDMDVTEKVSNDDIGFGMWTYRLSGTIQIARPYPQALAWKRFSAMMSNRITTHNKGRDNTKGVIILRSLEFSDRPFGRLSTFSVSWTLAWPLADIVAKSGMWTPIASESWAAWRSQMLAGPWQTYGPAGQKYDESRDVIIDLCQGGSANVPGKANDDDAGRGGSKEVFRKNRDVRAEDAWVTWQNWFHWVDDSGAVIHVKLAEKRIEEGGPRDNKERYKDSREQQKFDKAASDLRVQRLRGHRYRLVQTGRAIRANFPVTIPYVKSVGGKNVVIIVNRYRNTLIQVADGEDLYAATWHIEYDIDGAPGGAIELKDPNRLGK